MNKLIEELAKQAGFELNPVHFDHEKFARLIVRECANYAFSDEQEHKAMLKHFGVE